MIRALLNRLSPPLAVSAGRDERRIFAERARALLDELDQASGPDALEDWNIRAAVLLTFECCRQLAAKEVNE